MKVRGFGSVTRCTKPAGRDFDESKSAQKWKWGCKITDVKVIQHGLNVNKQVDKPRRRAILWEEMERQKEKDRG